MASSTSATRSLVPLVFVLLLLAHRGNAGAVFTGLSFESQREAEAFDRGRSAAPGVLQRLVDAVGPRRGGVRVASRHTPRRRRQRPRAALRDTLGEAVAGLASLSNHAREEMAVRDCVELLGYSVDELGWSLDAMAPGCTPAGGSSGPCGTAPASPRSSTRSTGTTGQERASRAG
jgi:pectinesterase